MKYKVLFPNKYLKNDKFILIYLLIKIYWLTKINKKFI